MARNQKSKAIAGPLYEPGEATRFAERDDAYIFGTPYGRRRFNRKPAVWKWTVDLITRPVNSGEARSRSAAVSAIVLLVDKALMQKLGSPRTNEGNS
jgi:hypothetical protein